MNNEKPEVILYVSFKPPGSLNWPEYSPKELEQIRQYREYTDAELSHLFKDKITQRDVWLSFVEFLEKTYGTDIGSACVSIPFMRKFKEKRYY